jgi:hypothetical protein
MVAKGLRLGRGTGMSIVAAEPAVTTRYRANPRLISLLIPFDCKN